MDVKGALLNNTFENDIYMRILEGIEHDETTRDTHVCKLKKFLIENQSQEM